MSRIVVVGDAVLDRDVDGEVARVAPDAPVPVLDEREAVGRPGGAGLAAVLAATRCAPAGVEEVTLVTALGSDPSDAAAQELRRLLDRAGVEVVDLGWDGSTCEKIRLRCSRHALLRLDRGGEGSVRAEAGAMRRASEALGSARAVLVTDYGRGVAAHPEVRRAIAEVRRPVVWDPHRKGAEPVEGAQLCTPNRSELHALASAETAGPGEKETSLAATSALARGVLRAWRSRALAVTLGSAGALLVTGEGAPLVVPPPSVVEADPCGAGDAFAAAATAALAGGALHSDAVVAGVAGASSFLADGGVASLQEHPPAPVGPDRHPGARPLAEVASEARRLQAAGGTVVATGGCFDVLHAGHVALLESARALGDRLVVLLNSDDSVRRLKGPDRPVVAEADRAALLAALSPVDDVVLFSEDTPAEALAALRPKLFVKGGDYAGAGLPEAAVLGRWGGEVVLVPYLAGRSTTAVLERVRSSRDTTPPTR